jgi:hypothetical protein
MSYTVLIHLANEDPVVAELDALPGPEDQILLVTNPRRRDGKDLHYVEPEVQTLIFPWNRITFIEVMPTEEEEEVVGFIRE